MARHRNANWTLPDPLNTWEQVGVAVLMDIREELQQANHHLQVLSSQIGCSNFTAIPKILARISANTRKKRRVAKRAKRA